MTVSESRFARRATLVLAVVASVALLPALTGGTLAAAGTDSTLQSWGDEQVVTQDVRLDQDPTVVVTPAGRSVAMWIERRPASDRLMVSELLPGSASWTTPTLLNKGAFYAAITAHGYDRVTVAWQQFEPGGASISSRTLRRDGTWGPDRVISQWTQTGGVTVSLVIAGNAQGDMTAVWTRRNHIHASYRTAGGAWQPEAVLPEAGAYAYDAVANVDRTGQVDLVFTVPATQGKSDLLVYHRSLNGDWSGQWVARIATGVHFLGSTFSADANANGDVAVAWMERARASAAWQVRTRFQPSGEPFSDAELVAKRARLPDLAVDALGVTTIAWLERDSGTLKAQLSRRSAGGNWATPQTLVSRPTGGNFYPQLQVAVNGRGDAVVHVIGQHDGGAGMVDDHRMIRCPAGAECAAPFLLLGPSPYRAVTFIVTSVGGATAAWTRGCATEECIPTSVRAREMTPTS